MHLTIENFAVSLGVSSADLPPELHQKLDGFNFEYAPVLEPERDRLILRILTELDTGRFSQVGQHRESIWQDVWTEHLHRFIENRYALDSLIPKFINPDPIVRLQQQYVKPVDPAFELNYYQICRDWLFQTYCAHASAVYEIGCGSGYNLVALAQVFPKLRLYGMDWSPSSNQLINLVAEKHGLNLSGHHFDFFAPDASLRLEPNSVVLTMAALEQIGDRHAPFLNFLLHQSPALCLNLEPVLEFYNPDNLVDYLAIRYHQYRGYLSGYLTRLQELEREGAIEILSARRLGFGSLYHEAYSFIAWRPVR